MIKLTKQEIRRRYKEKSPIIGDVIFIIFGLIFEIGMPAVVLIAGIIALSYDTLIGLLPFLFFPIALGIGLMLFRGVLISSIKKRMDIRQNKYKIVRAKCIDNIFRKGDSDSPDRYYQVFETDDKTIEVENSGIATGDYAYLIVYKGWVEIVFNANNYYTDDYQTSFYNNSDEQEKELKSKRFRSICGRIVLEYLLFAVVSLNIIGCMSKEWIIVISSGLLMLFYFLGSMIGGVHKKVTGIISIVYLFIAGILSIYLSYTYNYVTAAYIVGAIFLLISLISSIIWIVKSKKKKQ